MADKQPIMRITYTQDHHQKTFIIQIVIDDKDLVALPMRVNVQPRNFLSLSQQLIHLATVAEELELQTTEESEMEYSQLVSEEELEEKENEEKENEEEEEEVEEEDEEKEEEYEEEYEEEEDEEEEDSPDMTTEENTDEDNE